MTDNETNQKKASFGERFTAFLVDLILYFAAPLLVSIFVSTPLFSLAEGLESAKLATLLMSPIVILGLLWSLGYSIIFVGWRGQTPGKIIMKIKIIKEDGSKVGYPDAFMREVLGKLISSIAFFPLGYLWMLWDKPNEQTWHDKIARTVVVKVGATESQTSA